MIRLVDEKQTNETRQGNVTGRSDVKLNLLLVLRDECQHVNSQLTRAMK